MLKPYTDGIQYCNTSAISRKVGGYDKYDFSALGFDGRRSQLQMLHTQSLINACIPYLTAVDSKYLFVF